MAVLGVLLLALLGSTCVAATGRVEAPIYCQNAGDTFPVSNDCTAYIACDSNYVAHDALCTPGMYYQATDYGIGKCLIGTCTRPVCPYVGFECQDATNCHYYYKCLTISGTLDHLECAAGEYFNGRGCAPNLGAC